MLTEREEMIVRYVRHMADEFDDIGPVAWEHADHYREIARAIERGEHLKRPSPSIPYEEWVKTAGVG